MSDFARLSAKKIKAIETIVSGGSKRAAAKAAGVSEASLYRWAAEADFAAELTARKSELLDQVNGRLLLIALAATDALSQTLKSPDSQALSLRAADIALSKLMSIRELSEIEARLTKLESGGGDSIGD